MRIQNSTTVVDKIHTHFYTRVMIMGVTIHEDREYLTKGREYYLKVESTI